MSTSVSARKLVGERLTFQTPQDRTYLVDVEEGVLRLSFNRLEHGNALHADMIPALAELFRGANASSDVRAILIRGEGKTFSAGGDVAAFGRSLENDVADRQKDFSGRLETLRTLVEAVVEYEGPIVVAMRGAAAGAGLFFPLAADLVIGDPTAIFAFAHQGIGLCPDTGVSALLPQVVGHRTARSLLMTGAKVKADEALRLGLLNRMVAAEDLEAEALAQAKRVARAPRRAVKLAKKLVNDAWRRSFGEQLDAEAAGVVSCVADDDFAEGVRAFLEKRAPNFPSTR